MSIEIHFWISTGKHEDSESETLFFSPKSLLDCGTVSEYAGLLNAFAPKVARDGLFTI